MCKYLPVTHCRLNCVRPTGWQSHRVPAGILRWPNVKGSKNWRCCCWKEKTSNFSCWGEWKTFHWLWGTGPLHCSADWSKTASHVISSYVGSSVGPGSQDAQPPYTQWPVEWLWRVSWPFWARISFGVNWDCSLAASEAMLICTSWEPAPWFSSLDSWGHRLALGLSRITGWTLQHSPQKGSASSKKGSGQVSPGVWASPAGQEWGPAHFSWWGYHTSLGAVPHHIIAPYGLMRPGTSALLVLGSCGLGSLDLQK